MKEMILASTVLVLLLVCGCLSQRYREDIWQELPEVDGMMGTGSYDDIVTAVERVAAGEKPEYFGDISAGFHPGDIPSPCHA